VRVGLDQKDPRILPDMGVRVSFLEPQQEQGAPRPAVTGVLVPASAVVSAGEGVGGSVVYAVENGRAHTRPVTPGQVYGDLRSVAGIEAGIKVVRAPPAGLADGARVTTAGDR
jgi:multidrug efflux pump subunit AcrA (membrane-fusion protein)